MKIRKTEPRDIDTVVKIYDDARIYMRQHNNLKQWADGYPSREDVITDIEKGISYIVFDENTDEILCVFAFLSGPDITYGKIYEGSWPNNKPYHVIHRIAVSLHRKGVASFVYDECLKIADVIRIDTHKDNYPMQNSLKKNGFIYCGIIHLLNGEERLAYQKERT